MATRMQQRRATAEQWILNDPVLAAGEIGYETDTASFKIGDGINSWTLLDYFETSTALQGTIGDYIPLTEKGAPLGVAELDANGFVPATQLDIDLTAYYTSTETDSAISTAVSNLVDSAPGVLDTLNELAAAIGDDANFVTTINATIASGDSTTLASAQSYADQAEADAVTTANAYTDGEISTLDASLKTYADTAESDAVTTANAYTDTRETAITSAYQTYADTAETDAVASAATYTDGQISNLDTSLKAYADQAEADAISTAATDATTKANTAESNANTYTDNLVGDPTVDGTAGNTVKDRIDTAVSNLVDTAPGTLDTLNELAAALGDDPNFATTVASDIATKVSKSGDTMTGDLTLAQDPTLNLHAATKQYVDTAETDAVTTANTYTDGRETAITSAYQSYADQAETDAVTAANSYTDGREAVITGAYQAYADQAEVDAITTAASDATSKASTAESNANTYTDNLIGDATVDGTGGNTVTDRIASAVADLVDSSPATLDTLNELAAALGDDPNFATTIATDIGTKVDKSGDTMTGDLTLAQDPTLNLHAATKQYVDAAETGAVASAATYTDGEISSLDTSLKTYADTAEADAVTTANAYTDTRETAITAAYQAYADTAESDAVTTANAYTDGRESAITLAYQAYADQAEADAISTAAADATSKASTAESNANAYTDSAVSNVVGLAPESLDTLAELADALGDNPNAITTLQSDVTALQTDKADTNSPTFTGLTDFAGIVDFSDAVIVGLDTLPDQTGNAGKYLTTDGTTASWAVADSPVPHPFSMIG